jgi:hypothetical protein
VAPAAKEKKVS